MNIHGETYQHFLNQGFLFYESSGVITLTVNATVDKNNTSIMCTFEDNDGSDQLDQSETATLLVISSKSLTNDIRVKLVLV